jgi:hypothetical protein
MSWPTDEAAMELLQANAKRTKQDNWLFSHPVPGSVVPRPTVEALAIVKACMYLGVPVNDTILGRAWGELVRRVALLEEVGGLG